MKSSTMSINVNHELPLKFDKLISLCCFLICSFRMKLLLDGDSNRNISSKIQIKAKIILNTDSSFGKKED